MLAALALPLAMALSGAETANEPVALAEPMNSPAALATTPLLDRAPAPLDDPPERGRRWFELGPELGVGVPHCKRDGGAGCASLAAGPELGLVALMRPIPYLAFGVEGRRVAFDIGSADGNGATHASALFAGLVGRLYFLETDRLDPYLDLALGAGSLALSADDHGSAVHETVNFSLAARSAIGLDLLPNSWLRFGAFFSVLRYFPSSVVHCEAAACGSIAPSAGLLAVGATTLGIRVSAALGELL
jgi:hypothetical protein